MPKREYILDGTQFSSLEEAAPVFTRALELPRPWTGNLDLFDELLDDKATRREEESVVIWRNSEQSRKQLNYEETARWYEQRLMTCHTSTFPAFEANLARAQQHEGPTVFDWLVEILGDHVEVRLE